MMTNNRPITQYEKLELDGAFWTYKIWEGIRRHFNYKNYDWDDYGPLANAKFSTFENHRHRWAFVKLHRRFRGREAELIAHLAANFMLNKKFYIINALSKAALDNTKEYIRDNEDFQYNFRNWMSTYIPLALKKNRTNSFESLVKPDGSKPTWLFNALVNDEIPLWVAVGLDRMLRFQPRYHQVYGDNFVWYEAEAKLIKAYPFYVFDIDESKQWALRWIRENGYN